MRAGPSREAPGGVHSDPRCRPLARQAAQWRVLLPFYARAFALQGSHPVVARALVDHSSVFEDPWGRVVGTTGYALRFLFGTDRRATARELRRLHASIAGMGYDGRPYRAWDADVWTWVHLTTTEALLYALDVMCGPLPRRELQAFYEESRRNGELLGVRTADMPADVTGLRRYVDEGVRTKLAWNPGTDRLRAGVLAGQHLRALPLPGVVRAFVGPLLARPADLLLFGAFPAEVRRLWGIRWSRSRQAQYVTVLVALRAATEPLPERLRMLGPAYRALHARPAA